MKTMSYVVLALIPLLAILGCSESTPTTDAGMSPDVGASPDAAGEADAGAPDVGASPDAGGEADAGAPDVGGPWTDAVCLSDWHPVAGMATLMTFWGPGLAVSYVPYEVQLDGPSRVRIASIAQPHNYFNLGISCPLQVLPGNYTLRLLQGGDDLYSASTTLSENTLSMLVGYTHPANGTSLNVFPVDLSVPGEDKWRVMLINLAEDAHAQVDLYSYPVGTTTETDLTSVVPTSLFSVAYGASGDASVDIGTIIYEITPHGVAATGDTPFHFGWGDGTGVPSVPAVYCVLLFCDPDPTNDEGGPCYGHGAYYGYQLLYPLAGE